MHDNQEDIERILERYERYTYAEQQQVCNGAVHLQQESWSMEYPKLKNRLEMLQSNLRHYAGEDLNPLGVRELQTLEQQIDVALKRIRSRKNQLMHESISELQRKEKALQEQNRMLTNKLKGNEPMNKQVNFEQRDLCRNSSSVLLQTPSSSLPSLTVCGTFQERGAARGEVMSRTQPPTSVCMPPWMLSYMNE
ncbi:hypothetical protein ACFE04_006165 [Oxalis oulophora]